MGAAAGSETATTRVQERISEIVATRAMMIDMEANQRGQTEMIAQRAEHPMQEIAQKERRQHSSMRLRLRRTERLKDRRDLNGL
eukprot:7644005-Pyramimonas_sp.AAC.1